MPDQAQLMKRQQVLADFGEFAIRSDDLDEVLTEACRLVGEALGTGRAKVLEIQKGRQELLVRAGVGWAPDVVGTVRLHMGDRSSETYAIETAAPVISQDVATETRFDIPEFMKKAGVVALVNVPIFVPGKRPYGILQVDATTPRKFGEDEIQSLRTYAMILGPVIDRLHLLTERTKVQERLEASEVRHRLLVESWAQAVWETDPAGVVVTDSPSWRAYTGQTLEEWLGSGWLDAIHPDDRAHAERQWREAVSACWNVNAEFRLHAPDGGWRWTNVRAAPVIDAGGKIEKWFGLNIDIDVRKRAEEARQESESKYRTLFGAIDEGFAIFDMIYDAAGRPVDFRYVETNPAFEQQAGRRPRPGQTMRELLPEAEDMWLADYAEVARTGQAKRFVDRVEGLDRWFDVYVFPVDGPPGRLAALFRDVTDSKRAEEALRKSEERHGFLVRFADAVRGLTDPAAVATAACRMLLEEMDVDRAHWSEIDWKTEEFVTVGSVAAPGLVPIKGRFPLTAWQPYSGSHREGRTVVVDDTRTDPRTDGAMRATAASMDIGADLAAPVLVGERLASVLAVKRRQPRRWTSEEIALVEGIASRCWAEVERVRTAAALRASEERQRLTIELVPALLWSASPDGREITLNEGWFFYTGQSEAETQGYGWLRAVHPDDLPATRAAFEHAFASGESLERQQRIHKAGNGWRWHLVRHVPLRDEHGAITRWFGAAVDIHDSKLAEQALDRSEHWLQTLMQGVPQLVWRAVDDGHWTWASPQWTDFTGQAEVDSHDWGWLDPVHPDDRERVKVVWAGAIARGEFHADYRICRAAEHRYRWFQTRATPVRDDKGEIVEWLGTSTDVDDLRASRERQQVLLAELQHRVRNILAVIRSIVSRSDDGERSTEDYVQHLQGRIAALARTQVLLTRRAGVGVDLEEMIRDELVAQTASGAQFALAGPDIELSPKAAEVLTLAIHELATNATKYGAFSRASGHLAVEWSVDIRDDQRWLTLVWKERGVPIVDAVPRRQGFGSELVSRRIPYELKGTGSFVLKPGGLESHIEFPLRSGDSILQTSGVA